MNLKKLLVIVDPQVDFITGVLGSERANRIVERIVEKVKGWDGTIYITMDTHYMPSYGDSVEGKRYPYHCIRGVDGWKIDPRILEAVKACGTYIVQEKRGSFADQQLPWYVERYGIDSVEFIGYCTDICVISSALLLRSAKPALDISVDANCCCGSSYDGHLRALGVMESCCIDILR